MFTNRLVKSASILCLMVGIPSYGYACRCIEPASTALAYQQADIVLLGKVLTINGDINKDGGAIAKIDVLKSWKQTIETQVDVVTKTTCAYNFKIGEEYLLFLRKNKQTNELTTERCKGNLPVTEAKHALEWLEQHTKIIDNPQGSRLKD
jgi:hypothetical protein